MHLTPRTGPRFSVSNGGWGRRATEPRHALARHLTALGLLDGHTALDLRGELYFAESDPHLSRWDREEVEARIDCLGGVRLDFATGMAQAKPVQEVAYVVRPDEAPAPVQVLPPPVRRSTAAADPGPAARAFQNASRTGAATVCKGPCEACGQA